MNKKFIRFLYIFMPLTAVIALGASLYLWYQALTPDLKPITILHLSKVSPHAFSAGLEGNLFITLEELGIGEKEIKSRQADPVRDGVQCIYTIRIPQNLSLSLLNLRLTTMAEEMGGHVFQGIEGSDGKTLTLTVGVGKTPTDIIILRKLRGIFARTAKVAVIVDDLGIKSLDLARRLCNLEQIVTLSILPFQRRTSQVVDLARETDTPYMLHMPMEPKSKLNPGEGAIYIGDSKSDVRKKLVRAFESVDGAEGLNNHMGSKVTEDVRTMEYILDYLSEKGYFFLDSQTSRQSRGYHISQKSGVMGARISGYIDVEDEKDYIEKRLDTLIQRAIQKGSAIILCHDRPNTVDILEKKLAELEDKGIQFVSVSDLIH